MPHCIFDLHLTEPTTANTKKIRRKTESSVVFSILPNLVCSMRNFYGLAKTITVILSMFIRLMTKYEIDSIQFKEAVQAAANANSKFQC